MFLNARFRALMKRGRRVYFLECVTVGLGGATTSTLRPLSPLWAWCLAVWEVTETGLRENHLRSFPLAICPGTPGDRLKLCKPQRSAWRQVLSLYSPPFLPPSLVDFCTPLSHVFQRNPGHFSHSSFPKR